MSVYVNGENEKVVGRLSTRTVIINSCFSLMSYVNINTDKQKRNLNLKFMGSKFVIEFITYFIAGFAIK